MHIAEGVLSPPVLIAGGALTMVTCVASLRRLDEGRLIPVALLSATFFVASLVHVPVGPASAHLILNGLLGAILGMAAFPAILIALLLQALLFQYGGLTTLGVNTWNMAMPAVLIGALARPRLNRQDWRRPAAAFFCGSLGVAGATLCTALSLALSDEGFYTAAKILVMTHIPVMLIEGLVTVFTVSFLARVRPELFNNTLGK